MKATLTQATGKDMKAALEAAYLAQGVKHHTEVDGLFLSPVQHNAPRAKAILADAAGRLARRGLEHTLRLIYPQKGDKVYAIAFSA